MKEVLKNYWFYAATLILTVLLLSGLKDLAFVSGILATLLALAVSQDQRTLDRRLLQIKLEAISGGINRNELDLDTFKAAALSKLTENNKLSEALLDWANALRKSNVALLEELIRVSSDNFLRTTIPDPQVSITENRILGFVKIGNASLFQLLNELPADIREAFLNDIRHNLIKFFSHYEQKRKGFKEKPVDSVEPNGTTSAIGTDAGNPADTPSS